MSERASGLRAVSEAATPVEALSYVAGAAVGAAEAALKALDLGDVTTASERLLHIRDLDRALRARSDMLGLLHGGD